MLKKLAILLCLGAFVVAIGCGEKEEEKPEGDETPAETEDK